jgi:hypothetical protein
MNKLTRNLILPAAALAALLLAPGSEARAAERGRAQEPRGHERYEGRRVYARPPVRGYRYVAPYRASYRVAPGLRFYAAYPGPGYVWIAGCGWTLPPFFGAVWVPGHYDVSGFRVEGFWR